MASKELVCGGESYKISYEISNLQRTEYILVLHGWGANKALMSRVFADKFRRYALVCVDLPGFGASSQPARALGSEDYAEIMRAFIAAFGKQPAAIMGHSFGGKIGIASSAQSHTAKQRRYHRTQALCSARQNRDF